MAWKHRKSTRRHPHTWLLASIVVLTAEIQQFVDYVQAKAFEALFADE